MRNTFHRRGFVAAALALPLSSFVRPLHAADPAPPTVPDGVVYQPGIVYAKPGGEPLALNLARPKEKSKTPLPVVICIHGGGFRAGTRDGYNKLIIKLAQQGFVAVTVTYRLAPKHQFPAAVHDVKAAVRWVRLNARKLNLDPTRIGVMGASAGGHLAQFLGLTAGIERFEGGDNKGPSSRVSCVVNYYGPTDFTKSYGKSVDAAEVLPLWLGGDLKTAFARHVEASPLYWATPDAAPTLILHGTKDQYVAYEQAGWLVDRLRAAQAEVELVTFPEAKHGFKDADAEKAETAMFAFFDKHLKPSK